MDPSEDLMQLQETAKAWATDRLVEDGTFDPFGLAMLLDGSVAMVADGDGLDANEAISGFLRGLHAKRDELRAVAICADVRVSATGGDAIRLTLEHKGDLALELVTAYTLGDDGPAFDTTQIGRGPRFIWPEG